MCIVFFHSDPLCTLGNYKLIIAANRDEFFARPSLPAHFLPQNPNVLCGVDVESDGTWLGVTKTGRFGFLTNYLSPSLKEPGNSRGSIVRDFLNSNSSVEEYIGSKFKNQLYRPFNFIGGEVTATNIKAMYCSNKDPSSPYQLTKNNYTLACSRLGTEWNKVKHGTSKFEGIICDNSLTSNELTNFLIEDLLSDLTPLYPDDLIIKQCNSGLNETVLRSYCSVMVGGLPTYGTCTQTVVLLDKDNHLYFCEKNRTFDTDMSSPKWQYNKFDFFLQLQ